MANTIRFGTAACGPQATASAGRAGIVEEVVEEFDNTGNTDPDKLLQCPYDKNHHIRASRFPYHLIKCGKNHPKLASELKTCPFNARHRLPRHMFNSHIETCVDRRSIDAEDVGNTNGSHNWQPPISTWVDTNMTEDWDQEVDDNAAPFVWGVNTVLNEKLETRPTNNLGPSFRTPNNFPWSDS